MKARQRRACRFARQMANEGFDEVTMILGKILKKVLSEQEYVCEATHRRGMECSERGT